MKTVKLFMLFVLTAFISCQENENFVEQSSTITKETAFLKSVESKNFSSESIVFLDFPKPLELSASLSFDTQDNLMQLNYGNWFSNNNPYFSIELHPNENKIFIRSQIYQINVLEMVDYFSEPYIYYSADRKTVAIYYHKLNTHLYHTDMFDFDVYYCPIRKRIPKDLIELEYY